MNYKNRKTIVNRRPTLFIFVSTWLHCCALHFIVTIWLQSNCEREHKHNANYVNIKRKGQRQHFINILTIVQKTRTIFMLCYDKRPF